MRKGYLPSMLSETSHDAQSGLHPRNSPPPPLLRGTEGLRGGGVRRRAPGVDRGPLGAIAGETEGGGKEEPPHGRVGPEHRRQVGGRGPVDVGVGEGGGGTWVRGGETHKDEPSQSPPWGEGGDTH